jgi:monofunctional biosynthetic peptidoglycan transglycosylase
MDGVMMSLNSDGAAAPPEGNVGEQPKPAWAVRSGRPRKPMTAARVLRRFVQIGLGLILLWVGAVFWLGLLYWAVPPVSTLMLGRWLTLQPVERTFVRLDEISPNLSLAVLASEDSRFCEHNGVDWDALRDVVEAADGDGPSRGASTIPMQVAKNLFLWPSRSYVRKGLELPVALYLGKSAKNLTGREAALLARALPNPLARNPARPRPGHRALAGQLQARMAAAAPFSGCLKP